MRCASRCKSIVLLKIAIGQKAGPLRRGIERDFARMLDNDPQEIGLRLGLTEEEMMLLCLRVIGARSAAAARTVAAG